MYCPRIFIHRHITCSVLCTCMHIYRYTCLHVYVDHNNWVIKHTYVYTCNNYFLLWTYALDFAGGEKGDGQQQQHVQQVVAHQQPLVHGQQNGQQNGQQPVQHMQQREEQPEEHRLQHHEQPVVHEQPIVQQPVVQEQPNVQEPVPAEQHFQQPVAADEQHVQQPVAIEQHVQQPVGVQEGGVAVDNAQAHQQPLVEQPPHQEGLQDPGAL